MIQNLREILFPNNEIKLAINKRNLNIIFYVSFITIISRILSIQSFLKQAPTNHNGAIWQKKIIDLHFILLVVWIVIFIFTLFYKYINKDFKGYQIIEFIAFISMVLLGMFAALIDQYIASDITAFLIGVVVPTILIIINPILSSIILLANYFTFTYLLPMVQLKPEIVLSNKTNALVITSFSIFLSFLLYQSFVKNEQQEHYIKRQKEALEYLAHTDPLTNLMNRRRFIELVREKKEQGVIAAIDIDDFKKINDRYGHPIGDETLKEFSRNLVDCFEDSLIARFGGEEFLILMQNISSEKAYEKLENFRHLIENKQFVLKNQQVNFTISIGFIQKLEGKDSFYTAYQAADRALYKAKEKGKNIVLKG